MIQIPKFIKDVTKYFQYETSPTPTTEDELQAFHKNQNSTLACLVDQLWQSETAYELNHQVFSPNMPKGFKATVKQAGVTGSNEPDWGDGSEEVVDGSVTWKLSKGNITVNGIESDPNGNIEIPAVSMLDAYPVGAIYISTVATSPNILFKGGTWQPLPSGVVLLAQGQSTWGVNYTAGSTGGEDKHKLTVNEIPTHTHAGSANSTGAHTHTSIALKSVDNTSTDGEKGNIVNSYSSNTGSAGTHSHTLTIKNTGGGQAHSNMQPYLSVYMWKRTA